MSFSRSLWLAIFCLYPFFAFCFAQGTMNELKDAAGGETNIHFIPAPTGKDDLKNIQDCIDHVFNNHSGGQIFFRAGTYLISNSIVLKDGVILSGQSLKSTIIKPLSSSYSARSIIEISPSLTNTSANILDGYAPMCSLKNLVVHGVVGSPSIVGVLMGGTTALCPTLFSTIENVKVQYCAVGFRVESWFSKLYNCDVQKCDTGYSIRTLTKNSSGYYGRSNNVSMNSCHFNRGKVGVSIMGQINHVTDCEIINFESYGVHVTFPQSTERWNHGDANSVVGNTLGSDEPNAVAIKIESLGNVVMGNLFEMHDRNKCIDIGQNFTGGNSIFANSSGETEDHGLYYTVPSVFHGPVSIGAGEGYVMGSMNSKSNLSISGLITATNRTDALNKGLKVNDVYRTATGALMIVY